MMQVRLLNNHDSTALEAFLQPHTPWAYFMRSNPRIGGLAFANKPYQADYFGAWQGERLCGLVAHSWTGSVQCFLPELAAVAPIIDLWAQRLRERPRMIDCILGAPTYVSAVCQASGFRPVDFRPIKGDEELFTLDLAAMQIPPILHDAAMVVRPATPDDATILVPWRHDYFVETMGDAPGVATMTKAQNNLADRLQDGGFFVLEHNHQPVAFCGADGYLPDWKIVGPVWTPPELRRQGYARALVAGALLRLQASGATHAVLFSGNPLAVRAYRALGFEKIGDWRLDVFKEPPTNLPLPVRAEEA